MLIEFIIDGGEKDWCFDIVFFLLFKIVNIFGFFMYIGKICLIEVDGFGFYCLKEVFKNDRVK